MKARIKQIDEEGNRVIEVIETTRAGAMLAASAAERQGCSFDLVNKLMTKKGEVSTSSTPSIATAARKDTVIFCDQMMALGFREAFKAGISFGKDDMVIPDLK